MRKQIIVTSSIRPREGKFTYSNTRSFFSTEERFRQTVYTVNSLRNSIPDCEIVIVDTSDDYEEYRKTFSYFPNTVYVPLKELSEEVFEITNTHKNKSYCESLILNTYYKKYRTYIKKLDFIGKTSGRYCHFNFNDSLLTEENRDKFFFKHPVGWEWQDVWGYHMVDNRAQQGNNMFHQYSSVLYMYGIENLDRMMDINEMIMHITNKQEYSHYDVETLLFYLTRQYQSQIIETNWLVCGWEGAGGGFLYY